MRGKLSYDKVISQIRGGKDEHFILDNWIPTGKKYFASIYHKIYQNTVQMITDLKLKLKFQDY